MVTNKDEMRQNKTQSHKDEEKLQERNKSSRAKKYTRQWRVGYACHDAPLPALNEWRL